MCIIFDANCMGLLTSGDASMVPVSKYFLKNGSIAIGGGKLAGEYQNNRKMISLLNKLGQSGQVHRLPNDAVDRKQVEIETLKNAASDDPHILAIAALSNARILVSHDQPLHQDFTSTLFFSQRGRVYQNQSHALLLVDLPRCA